MGGHKKKSPYRAGNRLVKARIISNKYGNKVENIKAGSSYDRTGERFTMRSVNSSNIDEIGYKRNTNTLRIKFKGGKKSLGGTYDYYNVPETLHRPFINAASKGIYFHQNIKFKYIYARVK